jgi:leader peptidase (prepilin peptidase)/N-methyltransferase
LSWVLLRGRCRDCSEPISARYPLIEAVTAALFVAVVLVDGFGPRLLLDLPFVAMLVAVAAIDIDRRIVPNRIVVPAAAWAILVTFLVDRPALAESLIAGAGAFCFLLLVALLYPAGMGMGDVKLAGTIGLFLGLSVVPALLVAFLAGSLVGLALIAREGSAARKRALPFAPFLALGAVAGLFAGPQLIALYSAQFLA